MRRNAAAMAIALVALPAAGLGCGAPTRPPIPPSGGRTLDLSYDQFAARVEPILVRHGCDATADCHGGGIRGTLELSPPSSKNVRFDFDQVSMQVWAYAPDSSTILTAPLAYAAGGTPHALKPFATTADSEYQAIRTWIVDGITP